MLTKKQTIFAKFMINQIGIDEENFVEKYLHYLEKIYGKMISTRTDRYGNDIWRYSTSDCIEALIEEINLRKGLSQIKQIHKSKSYLNATEVSNYVFCPANFSISESFEIEKPNGIEFSDLGNELHEELILLRNIERYYGKYQTGYVDKITFQEEEIKNIFESNEQLKKILQSKLIFCGHNNENTIFVNDKIKFKGIPDYIFEDVHGKFFVVEEKFHYKKDLWKESYLEKRYNFNDNTRVDDALEWDKNKIIFYKNHIIQTYSYLRNIIEYDLEYGLLIYWFYDFKQNGFPYIHRGEVKIIEKNTYIEKYYQNIINSIERLIRDSVQQFDAINLNPFKCAGCIVSKYCAHKSGKLKKLSLPYNLNDLHLNYVPFPDELRKTPNRPNNNEPLPF